MEDISITDLAIGLEMDRSNLNKLVKKLNLKPKKLRGKMNQWTHYFTSNDVESILSYREGIPHNLLRKKDGSFYIKKII